jgi:hypothetical protein
MSVRRKPPIGAVVVVDVELAAVDRSRRDRGAVLGDDTDASGAIAGAATCRRKTGFSDFQETAVSTCAAEMQPRSEGGSKKGIGRSSPRPVWKPVARPYALYAA